MADSVLSDVVVTLGIDLSTQSITGVISQTARALGIVSVLAEASINFDATLPQYETANGVQRRRRCGGADCAEEAVTSPVAMWIDGLEMLLTTLRAEHPHVVRCVAAVSVSAQQHAAVLVADPAAMADAVRKDDRPRLSERLAAALATPDARVWMDASTAIDRRAFLARLPPAADDTVLDDAAVRAISGARVELRYVAPQLMGLERLTPGLVSASTQRVHLCSSFVASLLAGVADAPVDRGDAAGTNLYDLRGGDWSPVLCAGTAIDELRGKLGPPPAPAGTLLAKRLSPWAAARLFGDDGTVEARTLPCAVAVGSGDNPCSLVGCFASAPGEGAASGAVSVSLGTSDTACLATGPWASEAFATPEPGASDGRLPRSLLAEPCGMGNALPSAAARGACLAMACLTRTGGAIARAAVGRSVAASHDAVEREAWATVAKAATNDETLDSIVVAMDRFANVLASMRPSDDVVAAVERATEGEAAPGAAYVALALLQAACLALSFGARAAKSSGSGGGGRVFVTGGGSRSRFLCCAVAWAFGATTVQRLRQSGNTAGLGAAIIASSAIAPETLTFHPAPELVESFDVPAVAAAETGNDSEAVAHLIDRCLRGISIAP